MTDIVKLAFTERAELRYIDRVMPQPDETIEQYLATQVHGLASGLGGRPIHSYAEAMNKIGNIKLLSRVAIQDGPLAFLPDLQSRNMHIAEKIHILLRYQCNCRQ